MAHLGAFKNMFEEIQDPATGGKRSKGEDGVLGRSEGGFVGLDNQGATCYLNALLQTIYMTPELRHGLYAVDPKELGGDKYEAEREQDREKAKARLAKDRARLKKQEAEGRMQPDPDIVKQLVGMFSLQGARRAALNTKNKSLESAIEWALEHSEDPGFDGPLSGYDDDGDEAATRDGRGAAGLEDGGGDGSIVAGKKKKGTKAKSAKMIPLELQRLFARLQLLDARTVSTEDLTERGFKWNNDEGRVQHDAHELIRLLIDRLEMDMKFSKVNSGLVSALYEGELANQVKCLACGYVSERGEKYRDVLLQVAGQEDLVTSLLSYTRPERLSGDNKYFCDRCQEKQDALRSQTLRALPPVLIFSLNRFEFDYETMERVKVQQAFKYPLALDMEPFVEGRAWDGNDNSDESQVPALAGDPEVPGTCRNRQKWVPQAWKEAEQEAGDVIEPSPASAEDDRRAARVEVELRSGVGWKGAGGAKKEERGGGEGGAGGGEGGSGLMYDLLAVVVHRGSAYSGHYHALIRDCLQEGRWLPPSGFEPSQTSCREEVEGEAGGGKEGGVKEEVGVGARRDEGKKESGGPPARTRGPPLVGNSLAALSNIATDGPPGPMDLLVDIMKTAPKHNEVKVPFMTLPALRNEAKRRLGGVKWGKQYAKNHGKLEKFLEANSNTFLMQETPNGPKEVLFISGEEGGAEASKGNATDADVEIPAEDAELAEVLRLSLAQSTGEPSSSNHSHLGAAPANGTALAGAVRGGTGKGVSGEEKAVPPGMVEALASEKCGRWFSFDDRKVTPISILDLEKPFYGGETAYLLVYRSRSLDQEIAPPAVAAAAASPLSGLPSSSTGVGKGVGGLVRGGGGGARALPGGLQMTSVPPSYWMDKVDNENASFKTVKDTRDAGLHAFKVKIWLPRLLSPQAPHLVPLKPNSPELEQLPEHLRSPLVLTLDDRQTVSDLKREALRRVGNFCREMGVPDGPGRVRLSELTAHGPGLFLSQHLPDMTIPAGRGGGRRGARSSGGGGRNGNGGWGDGDGGRPTSAVLGDLEWDLGEEPAVLVWDGDGVGGVELPNPCPETRPICLQVSVLKPTHDVGPFAWIDEVLTQGGTCPGPTPTRSGARAETAVKWDDIYVLAGASATDLVDLVSSRGGGGIASSKMCISLLQASQLNSADSHSGGNSGGYSARRRSSDKGGGVQMEALQISGPPGVFEEWKPSGGGKQGSGGGEAQSAGLGLVDGSELLVEEQGAVSQIITADSSSLADMEVARRSRMVRVSVEVEEPFLESLRDHGQALAHDVAVTFHNERRVTLEIEVDALDTGIPHLKARCLLSLVPGLATLPASAAGSLLPPPPSPSNSNSNSAGQAAQAARLGNSTGSNSSGGGGAGGKDELALVGLVKRVRLENSKSGYALEEAGEGASLKTARVSDGACLVLEWGVPPETGKARVKFSVRVGNSISSARDPTKGRGTVFGPLEVIAELKEPVAALKARMIQKAVEQGFFADNDGQERRIRVEPLLGDSSTLIEELKDAEPTKASPSATLSLPSTPVSSKLLEGPDKGVKGVPTAKGGKGKKEGGGGGGGSGGGKGKGKGEAKGDAKGEGSNDGGEEGLAGDDKRDEEDGGEGAGAGEEKDGGGGGAGGKGKKKKRKKKGGGGGGGGGGAKGGAPAVEKNGAIEDGIASSNAGTVTATDLATTRVDEGSTNLDTVELFQDKLVEESGILGGEEIYLEDGRVPRPRELEITVLAYAPHFLGLATAAANEALANRSNGTTDEKINANINGYISEAIDGGTMAEGASGRGNRFSEPSGGGGGGSSGSVVALGGGGGGKGEGGGEGTAWAGCVPVGLSEESVWVDEEAGRKEADVKRYRSDPAKMLSLQRQLSLRTLGNFHIDERRSLADLRGVLKGYLSEGLRRATKASIRHSVKAAQEAAAAAAAASAAAAAAATAAAEAEAARAAAATVDADSDVMRDDELDNIRKSIKNKNAKPRKKRGGGGSSGRAAAQPPPLPPSPPSNKVSTTDAGGVLDTGLPETGPTNGHRSTAAADSGTVVPPHVPVGEELHAGQGEAFGKDAGREACEEVRTEFADSDDEIPLPEGVPVFQGLEEAMLVRELRKDRLPGNIVRGGDGGGDTAGGLFMGQLISELRLCSSVALVLCLRPRAPQSPLDWKSAHEMAERQCRERLAEELVENGQASQAGEAEGEEGGGQSLELEKKRLEVTKGLLEALDASLSDLVKKRLADEAAFEMGMKKADKAERISRSADQDSSVNAWNLHLKAMREDIDATREGKERPLEREVKGMRIAVEQIKKNIKKLEQDKDKDQANPTAAAPAPETILTRVKGVLLSGAKATFGFGRSTEIVDVPPSVAAAATANTAVLSQYRQGESESNGRLDREADAAASWDVSKAVGNVSKGSKAGGGKGGGKRPNASAVSALSAGGAAGAGGSASASSALAEAHRLRNDEVERRRTDPLTDLHLWTFLRKNPLADGGVLPTDDPEWPGPLKEVIVENRSQPTLENLHEALGKAYNLPADRVWAVKHNWGKHEWVRLTRELGVKKVVKKKKGKKGAGGDGKRQVTNLREAPYSLKDGDVIAVVDRLEDPEGHADLTRADDEAYREQSKGKPKAKKEKRRKRAAPKRRAPEIGLTLGGWDDGDEEEEDDSESDDSDDLADIIF